jgi:hypothetical protein
MMALDPTASSVSPTSLDPLGDQMVTDILAASAAQMPVEVYLDLRRLGDPHDQILHWWVFQVRSGKTEPRLRYMALRDLGYSHQEAIDVTDSSTTKVYHTADYHGCREAGATHQEALSGVCRAQAHDYITLRSVGIAHLDIVEIYCMEHPDPEEYLYFTQSGATHAQALRLMNRDMSYGVYEYAVVSGIAHDNIIAALDNHCDLKLYTDSRSSGRAHEQALTDARQPSRSAGLRSHTD